MPTMKTKMRVMVVFFAALGLAGVASAQSVLSYFASTPAVSAPSGAFTDWTKTLQLPAFDASLGTLTQVKLSYLGEALQTAGGENLSASSAPFSYNITTTLTVEKTSGPTLFSPAAIVLSGSGTNAAFDGGFDFAGASGFSFTQQITAVGSLLYTSAPILAEYTGTGMIDFTAIASATSSISGSGEFASETISKASAGLGVEYTFTPIPEPSTYALAIALMSLGWVALRKRKIAAV